jgi:hypothetical protein
MSADESDQPNEVPATTPAEMTATAAPPATPPPPAPGYRRFDTIGEYWQAVDQILALARREVFIFDIAFDANHDSSERIGMLRSLLAARPDNRLRFIVHDAQSLTRTCPRLCRLIRDFSESVSVAETTVAARSAADPLIVVDAQHALRRFHHTQPRSSLITHDAVATRPLLNRIEQIIEASEPVPSATVLGL